MHPQIIEEHESKKLSKNLVIDPNLAEEIGKRKPKKTTDELIEEYERKISKTKQLLEEEKIKAKSNIYETADIKPATQTNEVNCKSTPEFKSKKERQEDMPL